MSKYKLSDNSIVSPGAGFAFGGVQYGANWFETMNEEQKAAIGLTEIIQDPRPDGRFYFVQEDTVNLGKWISTQKPIDVIKAMLTAQVNGYVAAELAQTDWMHMRASDDPTKPVPEAVLSYRNAVRDRGNALVAEIAAAANFDALVAWQPHDWPVME